MHIRLKAYLHYIKQLVISPGGGIVAVALLVCALPFLAGIAFLTPENFGNAFHKVVAKSPKDVRVFGFANASRLSVDKSDGDRIVLIGASSMQAAFDSTIIEQEMFKLTGKNIPVYNLAVDSQTIMEFLGMAEHIPKDSAGKLFIKVSPISMSKDYSSAQTHIKLQNLDRFTLQSTALANELKKLGIRDAQRFDNFFLDNIAYFCARYKKILLNTVLNTRHEPKHVYIGKAPSDDTHWNRNGMGVIHALNTYEENKEHNFHYIRALVAYVNENTRMDITLVEQLYNPHFAKMYIHPGFYNRYQQEVRDLATQLNISYLDLPRALNLDADVFLDWTHIRSPEAIERASRQLVNPLYSEQNIQEKS